MAADLHCHTKYSDGSLTAEELVLLARRSGIDTIAVTDHDTFAGCERAASFGRKIGVRVLPGAEFSCVDPQTGRKAHVLCYQCSNPERLEPLCRKTCEARRKAGEAMLKKVMALYPISPQMVLRRAGCSTSLFKQHIMHALIDAGYAHEIFGPVFQKLFSRGGLASEPVPYPDVHAVLKEIRQAGGIAVLAHPGEYDSYRLLEQLAADHEIDGVEVWHSKNKAGDAEKFETIARAGNLLMTGGTDFHGMYSKVPVHLGTCLTPDDQLQRLENWKNGCGKIESAPYRIKDSMEEQK